MQQPLNWGILVLVPMDTYFTGGLWLSHSAKTKLDVTTAPIVAVCSVFLALCAVWLVRCALVSMSCLRLARTGEIGA